MTDFLTVVCYIVITIIVVVAFACVVMVFQCISWFHWKSCKHCGHTMEYKGLREDDGNGHYLFHCPKCGAWENIPREEFFREIDKGFDPNKNPV